ncbi:anthranilate phosphoribosyltransferase [Buchnera aphidicola]|uniref:Anthranilate phosphoribosyltransferase n=1 Tax=Buchnera aphidicola (Cinara strobi) TaxID=1921549 RepID=A0A3B1E9G7_9GAMM|nr:anthranilate phosphoribosyltransferase [Buchnera aphidicola]VAX76519.1 Anthranilate phosphoribosyltransferase [Buchnera aphidicola (Cinara strobi)]
MKNFLKKIYNGSYLSELESYNLFNNIFNKKFNDIQVSSILSILSSRNEKYEEVMGVYKAIKKNSKYFPKIDYNISDIVGTGGDQKNSFNISTVSSLVAASYGIKIAKICNFSASSHTGSADLLKKLKININISAKQSKYILDKCNVCFLLANSYYKIFKDLSKIRALLKIKTIFNILGPLLNPAQPNHILIGVYKPELMSLYERALYQLKYKKYMIIHSGGIDEATLYDKTNVVEVKNNNILKYTLFPKDFGLKKQPRDCILYKNPTENYLETIKLFQGKGEPVYTQTIAINVALLMKLLGNNDISKNTLNIINFIKTGKVYPFVLKLSQLYKKFN